MGAMRKRTTKKAAIGSAFDDFLKDEGTYEATQQVAIKRAEMARRMGDQSQPARQASRP
jgi:hypothetical protein